MERYLKNFKNCLQKEIPFCAAECPFHIDIPDFIEKIKRGGFKAAFKTYRNAAGFPLIASNLCHEPCKGVCPRKGTDSAIELLMLEKACIAFADDRSPTDYNLPSKKKKVAVIGAGISGLACALRLCMKKYEVEIFEASGRIGGHLWELMEPDLFLADIEEQFKYENYVLHLNTPVHSVDDLAEVGFDAVYVAAGEGGEDFGLISAAEEEVSGAAGQSSDSGENRHCALYGNTGWFAGGGLIGDKPVYALANGLYMGTVIDNFLKTGNLLNPENIQKTCMQLDPEKLKREEPVIPEIADGFSEEEAKREAARCLECQCDFCRSYCDLTDFYNKWPLRIRDEILATTLPGSADVKATPAKRLLSTCNQCGLCLETCPMDIDIGGLILAGRKSMHRQKKAPWVFHDFWLRDMDFVNSDSASLSMGPPSGSPCDYAFFPGCQLGASDPELVEKAYGYLLGKRPDTGLLLRCCGAPAEWSGDEEKFNGEVETVYKLWTEMGKPTLILACPTCEKKFKAYMAKIPVISLYEIMDQWGVESAVSDNMQAGKPAGKVYSVFDACAARHEKGMKSAVRRLAGTAGCKLEPMERHDVFEQCCGYGGQPGAANPKYAEFVAQKRIKESENPYITYCINCRDIFTEAGKETVHILDLLFGGGDSPQRLATVSERRENRIGLKRNLLKEFWNRETEEEKKENGRKVSIPEELAGKLSRERILEEDVIAALDFCERTGRRVFHPDRGTYGGYREIGHTTYWVEYRTPDGKNYELVNAYAHRMKIELEAVWNGRKVEPDL
ncbi:MAG TPA: heterodisulfide reductase-related iron-sulfur binding cluster [Anaerovoracaceae bacterium]|nr:heterodisulfide reductase-related iron-sulfur binding cluster [Anaerovoracaceae bacterium]